MENILKKRNGLLLNSFLVLLFMGVCLAWSVFVKPLEANFGWSRSQTSFVFTVNILCFSIGSILCGVLSRKFSFATLLKLGAIMVGLGFIISSQAKSIWTLYFGYGLITGTGVGLGYTCVLSSTPLWFPEKSGSTTGILLMGYALSTALFGPIINKLIQNTSCQTTFLVLGIVCGFGIFLGSFKLKTPSMQEEKQLPERPKKAATMNNVATNEMVKLPSFYLYFIWFVLMIAVGLSISNHLSPMLTEELGVSAGLAATLISGGSICNGVGRASWGTLSDKIETKNIVVLLNSCFFVASLVVLMGLKMNNPIIFIPGAFLLYFSWGGTGATAPTILRNLYGNRTFSLNYSIFNLNAIITAFFPTIIGSIQASAGSYLVPLIFLFVLACLGFVFVVLFRKAIEK